MAENDKTKSRSPRGGAADSTRGGGADESLAPAKAAGIGTTVPPNTQPVDIVRSTPLHITAQPGEAVSVRVKGTVPVNVTMKRPEPPNIDEDPSLILNVAIRNRSEALSFNRYREFIDRILCSDIPARNLGDDPTVVDTLRRGLPSMTTALSNVYAYELLKAATDAFLLMECGLIPHLARGDDRERDGLERIGTGGTTAIAIEGTRDAETGRPTKIVPGVSAAQLGRVISMAEVKQFLASYLGSRGLPYIDLIATTLVSQAQAHQVDSPFCVGILPNRMEPYFIELIWNYWQEEGMLVQTLSAISLRFQNKLSGPSGRNPLGHLELDPLRPLNNILWGYIQDELNRLTVSRRAYEYEHEYGLSLFGKAVPKVRPAERRSMFIEAFHNLLHRASIFFKEQADTQVIPDGFPLLNAIKEVHLILAEGAHNQFGDLPWTARVEMLIQMWLLSRPEMREFLGGRIMVPYPEPWMGIVDGMKALQGWTDASVRYFRDLAVFGEQLLLSIRYGNWSDISDEVSAKNWANYWRFAIQGYIHAYRAVTGVDLAVSTEAARLSTESYVQPSIHLRRRLDAQRQSR